MISSAIRSWGEHRPGQEAEGALAGRLLQHFGADDVGRHQVGGELDALPVEPEHDAQGLDQLGLGQTRHPDQEAMASGQQGHQRLLDHGLLAEDRLADAFAHLGEGRGGPLEMGGGAGALGHGIVHEGKVRGAWLPVQTAHPILGVAGT
ncbi:MAG: hypothetical protein WDN08_12840 [Rhizomicrobium sp.]